MGCCKVAANITKHGIDFTAIEAFDWDSAIINEEFRHGESRWIAHGFIGNRLHVVVFAERGDVIRVISLRKANQREVRNYAKA